MSDDVDRWWLAESVSHVEQMALRHAKALGYAEAMLTAIGEIADYPALVRVAVAETKAEIARICKGEPK